MTYADLNIRALLNFTQPISTFLTPSAQLKDSDLTAHVWRCLYDVARQYRESIDVYGTKKSFEWSLVEGEPSIVHVAKRPEPQIPEKVRTGNL